MVCTLYSYSLTLITNLLTGAIVVNSAVKFCRLKQMYGERLQMAALKRLSSDHIDNM